MGYASPFHFVTDCSVAGESKESILKAYPYLEPGVIQQALNYAVLRLMSKWLSLLHEIPS